MTDRNAPARKRLAGLVRETAPGLAVAIALQGVAAVLMVIQLILLAHLVDDLAFHGVGISAERVRVLWLCGATVARALTGWVADMVAGRAARRITAALRRDVFVHLLGARGVGMLAGGTGGAVTTLTDGIEALEPYLARYMPRAAMMLVVPLLILAVVARVDGWSFLILACAGPLIPVFMALVGYRAQAIMDRQWERLLLLGGSFLDFLQGMTTLRLLGRTADAIRAIGEMADDYRRATMAVMRVAFLTSAVLEFFASLSIALVAVVFGGRLLEGHATFRDAFLILLLAPEYFMPLRAFSASYHARQNAASAMQRIVDLLELPATPPVGMESFPTARPAFLTCDHVSVHYDGNESVEILHDLNVMFSRDVLSLITGESGVGKSTLLRVLLGVLPPVAGRVTAYDSAGRVIEGDWRQHVGWVPQRPRLLFGSVADNLRLGNPEADIDMLRDAAARAGALDFIEALPEGFDTAVGERGTRLSGGQLRRLALARVLLTDPDVLILDEPTADLDADAARSVMEGILNCVPGRIVIVAAHRAETIARAGRIYHLDGGRIDCPPRREEAA